MKPMTLTIVSKPELIKAVKDFRSDFAECPEQFFDFLHASTGGSLEIAKDVAAKLPSINELDRINNLEEILNVECGKCPVVEQKTQELVKLLKGKHQKSSLELIFILVSLSPEPTPIDFFRLGSVYLGDSLSIACQSSSSIEETIKSLTKQVNNQLPIITLSKIKNKLTISIMLPFYVSFKKYLTESKEEQSWVRQALLGLNEVFPDPEKIENRDICSLLLPHAKHLYKFVTDAKHRLTYSWRFLPRMTNYLKYIGKYDIAGEIGMLAVDVIEKRFGENDLVVVPAKRILANVQSYIGSHREAQKNFNKIIMINRIALIRSLIDYSDYHSVTGDVDNQRKCIDEAVTIASELMEKDKEPGPLILAKSKLGEHFTRIGLFNDAEIQLTEARTLFGDNLSIESYAVEISLARLYFIVGSFDKSVEIINNVKSDTEWENQTTDLLHIKAQANYILARIKQSQACYSESLRGYDEALQWYEKNQVYLLERIKIQIRKSSVFQEIGDLEKAETEIKEAEKGLVISFGPEHLVKVRHPIWATYYRIKALISFSKGKYLEALYYLEQARSFIRLPDHPDFIKINIDLAIIHIETAEFKKAEEKLERALEIIVQKLPSDNYIENKVSLLKGILLYKQEKDWDAINTLSLMLSNESKRMNPQDFASALLYRGMAYYQAGEFNKSESDLLSAQKRLKELFNSQIDFHPAIAHVYNCLARVKTKQMHIDKDETCKAAAFKYYESALAIRNKFGERIGNNEHPDIAWTLNGLAKYYLLVGQFKKSEAYYKQALNIRKQPSIGELHPEYSWSLSSLGFLYLQMSMKSKNQKQKQHYLQLSRNSFEESVKILENNSEHLRSLPFAHRLLNQAQYYLVTGEYSRALECLAEASRICDEKFQGYGSQLLAKIDIVYALTYKEQQLINKAIEYCNKALIYRRRVYLEYREEELDIAVLVKELVENTS